MILIVIEWIFVGLQVIAACLQLIGTFLYTELWSNMFAWSLSSTITPFLLAALNSLRMLRKNDRAVSLIVGIGNVAWVYFILLFGKTQGTPFDLRILMHATAAAVLAVFSFRAYLKA